MLTISKNLLWPRDLESFKGGKFNTLSLVDCYVQICNGNRRWNMCIGSHLNKWCWTWTVLCRRHELQPGSTVRWHYWGKLRWLLSTNRTCDNVSHNLFFLWWNTLIYCNWRGRFVTGNCHNLCHWTVSSEDSCTRCTNGVVGVDLWKACFFYLMWT